MTSIGKFVEFLWFIFGMMMIFFYTTNLRGNLIAKTYEKEIKTFQQILDRDENIPVVIPTSQYRLM